MVMYIADPVLPLGFLLVSTLVGLIPARTPSYCILVCILCILYIVLYIVTKLVGLITARTPLILSNVLSIVLYIVTTLVFRIPARTLIISVIHRRCEGITRHASQNTWCGSISAHHLYFFQRLNSKKTKAKTICRSGRAHVSWEQEDWGASGKEVWDVICLQVRTAPHPCSNTMHHWFVCLYFRVRNFTEKETWSVAK